MVPRRYVVVATLLATLVTAVLVVSGVLRDRPSAVDEPVAAPPEIPLAQLPLADVAASRTAFCDRVPDAAVEAAVGSVVAADEYRSGETARLEPGLRDVAHEFGCTYDHAGTTARAWVFAAPVSRVAAQGLTEDTDGRQGCEPGGVLRFGDPGTTVVCTERRERVFRAAGLIGDAWVHCELAVPRGDAEPDFLERAQRWCVAAVYALQA